MRPRPLARLALSVLATGLLATSSEAQTANFTGSLTIFIEGDQGVSTTATPILGSGTGVSFAPGGTAFTIPSGVFFSNTTTPVGFTPNAASGTLYTIRTITNTSHAAGAFSGTAGTGPYGGLMRADSPTTAELGIVPLPNFMGSIIVPLRLGVPGTVSLVNLFLGQSVPISVMGASWTTGVITVLTSPASPATVSGTNSLSASGGTITLVTPFLVTISGASPETRAGFAELRIVFSNVVPEPRAILLLGLAAVAATLGSAKRR